MRFPVVPEELPPLSPVIGLPPTPTRASSTSGFYLTKYCHLCKKVGKGFAGICRVFSEVFTRNWQHWLSMGNRAGAHGAGVRGTLSASCDF